MHSSAFKSSFISNKMHCDYPWFFRNLLFLSSLRLWISLENTISESKERALDAECL